MRYRGERERESGKSNTEKRERKLVESGKICRGERVDRDIEGVDGVAREI